MYCEARPRPKLIALRSYHRRAVSALICLLGATVEITSQQGEERERRFLLRKSIQRHWQGRNCPEKTRRKRPGNTHHSTAKQKKDCGGGGTEQHIGQTKPALRLQRRPAMRRGYSAPAFARCQTCPSQHLRQHRVLAIDADKVSVSILLNGRPFRYLILGQTVKVDPVEAN